MNPARRALLQGALALPMVTWVSSAFAAGPSERQVELFATWHAARRQGRPLLAIVIPDDDEVWERGRAVGGALGEASRGLLSVLADYAPVCATRADLHLLGVALRDDAWFAVIPTGELPVEARPIAGPQLAPGEDPIDGVLRVLAAALPPQPDGRPAGAGRETWVDKRLPGSHWASEGGCALYIEEVESQWSVDCGMGSMPERAARFLYFLDVRE